MNYKKDSFLKYLFDNIPEYKDYWLNDAKNWQTKPDLRTLGIEVQCLLWFVVNQIEKKNDKYLSLIFNLIENMLISDNDDAQYAAYMMFLESLYFRHDELPYKVYEKYLGSKSKEAIDEIAKS